MSQSVAHCHFLNRSDARRNEVFNLDRLTHAYKYSFDRYIACPRYLQLLTERQHRRGMEVEPQAGRDDQIPFVQLSLSAVYKRRQRLVA